jgi:alanine racemase
MNRMGIKNINDFKKIIKYENINIEGIYTHFISNKIEYKKYRLQQQKFKEYISLYNTPIIHSAASSSLDKEIIGNYVRVGMDLYNDAVNVYTKLGGIRYIKKGEYVGYDALYKAKKDGYIGILNIGYNEGMKTGVVKYHNKYYPVIGKICMNHTFIKLDKPIKNSSLLNIFPINDKIYKKDKYTIYERIVSYRNFKRIYITEYNYDLRKISKISLKKSNIIKQRTRSNKTFNA